MAQIKYDGNKTIFLQTLLQLYENYSIIPHQENHFDQFKPINLIDTLNNKDSYNKLDVINKAPIKKDSVVILFSGGKDSVATVLLCKEKYDKVILYHVTGLNRSYPDEILNAQAIAEYLNLPLVVNKIKYDGKSELRVNPLKNQITGALALNYCILNNLTPNIAVGDVQSDHLDESVYDLDYSDTFEMWNSFSLDAQILYPDFHLEMPLKNTTHALKVVTQDLELFKLCGGCMSPKRFKGQLIKTNESKYNIKLYPYRCGSCYKCAIEYIYLVNNNLIEPNKEFYKHCLDIFKRKYEETFPHNVKTKDIKIIYEAFMQEKYSDSWISHT